MQDIKEGPKDKGITITDPEIQALADGEFNGSCHSELMDRVVQTPQLQRRYNELCHQRELLRLWWSLSGKSS